MVDDGVLEVVYEPRLDHQSVCCRFCNRPQVDVEERPAVRMLLAEHLHRGGDSLAAVLRGVVVVHEQIYYAAFYLPDKLDELDVLERAFAADAGYLDFDNPAFPQQLALEHVDRLEGLNFLHFPFNPTISKFR